MMLDKLSIYGVISFFNFLTCLAIALFISIKAKKNKITWSYCFFDLCIAFYAFFYFLWQSSSDTSLSIVFFKLCILGVVLINTTFIQFTFSILDINSKYKKLLTLIHIINGFFSYAAVALFYKNWVIKYSYGLWPIPTRVFDIYLVWWFAQVGICFWLLYKYGISNSTGKNRKQFVWIFWATLVGFAGGATNWLVWYNINFPPYLNLGVAVYAILLGYAIFRYQILDIDVLIRKAVVYAGLFSFVYGTFTVVTIFGQEFFRNTLGINQWLVMIPTIIIITFSLRPLENFLINITEKFLFQKKYRYKDILQSYIDDVITQFDLDKIVEGTISLLNETLHPSIFAMLLFNKERNEFYSYRSIGIDSFVIDGVKFVKEFPKSKEILYLENTDDLKMPYLSKEMQTKKIVVLVPLFIQNECIGLMFLGEKKSDDDYTQEDLDILRDLAKTQAIAIKNARYVEEINLANAEVQRAKTMKQIADMADGMSHQFNNRFQAISVPLGVLKLTIEKFMKSSAGLTHEQQLSKSQELFQKCSEVIQKTTDNAVRGGAIAKGLLKYARPEKAGFEMQDISKIMLSSIEMLGYKHDDLSTISIQKDFKDNTPSTWANISYLQDIFFIVLDNAYDAIKQRKEKEPAHNGIIEIYIDYDQIKNFIKIYVKDNGIGMKPEILEKVRAAVPYVTTKASSSQKSGYGSGVQVLNRLVMLHQGQIEYDSKYGNGTTTTLSIPVKLALPQPAKEIQHA